MKPHPLTLAFVIRAADQPATNFPGHDLSVLESQVHGFDSALAATGQLQGHERFNRSFYRFIASKLGHSRAHTWSEALMEADGSSTRAEDRLQFELQLFRRALEQQ